ncbi:MAG TPA: PxKF domain-containing protein [Candidatus Limnocylindrales bacterium]|nr:PxKF domain-containing protein [Candidatus Limnocylindrales bacterium]
MFRRLRALSMLFAVLIGAVALPKTAAAATIDLDNCSGTAFDVFALWSAILDANDETGHPGPDTIRLAPACTYSLGADFTGTEFTMPPITSAVTIIGRNATLSVDAASTCICDPAGLFDIAAGGDLAISDVTLRNTAGHPDGSLFSNHGSALASNVVVDNQDDGMYGPAIVNASGASFSLYSSTIADLNTSDVTRGNAIANAGSMYVIDSVIHDAGTSLTFAKDEIATTNRRSISNTGSLHIMGSSLSVTPLNDGDKARWGAGIKNSGELVIERSTLSGHRASIPGAGIVNSGTLTLDASTLEHNMAFGTSGRGGGLVNEGTATILSSSFVGNYADQEGDGIRNAGSLSISWSSFWGTDEISTLVLLPVTYTGSVLPTCTGGGFVDGGDNMRAGSGCPGFLGDAKLALQQRSGLLPDAITLGVGSAARDAGGSACPATDQRGFNRPTGAACDIGANENQAPTTPTSLILASGSNPDAIGDLGFAWQGADPDGNPLSYVLEAKDADDPGWTQVYVGTTPAATVSSLAEGTWAVRVAASDGTLTSGYASLTGLVVDMSAPSAPTASADRSPDYVAIDSTGWYLDTVDVTFSGSTDPVLADGSAGSGIASVTPTQTVAISGAHDVDGTAVDAAGNTSGQTTLRVHVDADAPTVGFTVCPASVLLGKPATVSWSAADAESGLATAASGSMSVDTSFVGTRTISASATDNVGHSSTATCNVAVIYDFKGFARPVTNPPAFNKAAAGGIVLVSFSLGGAQGLSIFAPGYPVSAPIACGAGDELTAGTPTIGAAPALVYGGGRYTYQWKTDKAWAGTCRQFIVQLIDGTYHRANFSFK